jgi:hypothetical protein
MPDLMFVPQPTSGLAFDIFVDQPEAPSGIEPGEVRAPTRKAELSRAIFSLRGTRVSPATSVRTFITDALHPAARGPAIAKLPAAWRLLLVEVHAEEVKRRNLPTRCVSCLR